MDGTMTPADMAAVMGNEGAGGCGGGMWIFALLILLAIGGGGGLYQIEFAVNINATAAGEVSLQMAKNGIPLQETKRSQTLAVGDSVMETGTVRYLATCCCQEPTRIQLLIGAEGAAAGTVNLVSGCIVKLA